MGNKNNIIEKATLEVFEELGLPEPIVSYLNNKTCYTFGNGIKVELSKGVKNPSEEYQRIHISNFFMVDFKKRMEIVKTLTYNSFKERLTKKIKPLIGEQVN